MIASNTKGLARVMVLVGVAFLAVACIAPVRVHTMEPAPAVYQTPAPAVYQTPAPAPASATYVPQYYNGNVVYFDASGSPFYYLNGATTSVPRSCSCYQGYVNHYRTYRLSYQRWYATEGVRLISVGLNLGL